MGPMSVVTSAPIPALMLAAFATLAVAGCGIDVSLDDDATRPIEHDDLPVADLRRLDVTTDIGEIHVRGGGGDEITVRSLLVERNEGDAEYSLDVDGDRLVVHGEWDARWWDRCSVGFVVTVPSDFEVDIETDNGRVEVADVDGEVRVETDNGAIDAERLGSAIVDTRTDNGRIRLAFDEAPTVVSAASGNGAIAVRLPDLDLEYAVDAASTRGRVDVRTDPAADRRVTARSDNGQIDVEYRTG